MLMGVVSARAVHKPEFPPIFDRKLINEGRSQCVVLLPNVEYHV